MDAGIVVLLVSSAVVEMVYLAAVDVVVAATVDVVTSLDVVAVVVEVSGGRVKLKSPEEIPAGEVAALDTATTARI